MRELKRLFVAASVGAGLFVALVFADVKDPATIKTDATADLATNTEMFLQPTIDVIDSINLKFANHTAMEAGGTNLPNDTIAYLENHTTAGSGIGSGIFRLDTSAGLGAGAEDDGVIFTSAGGTNWYWRRLLSSNEVTPRMYNAKGDSTGKSTGTDDTVAFQAALDSGISVIVPVAEPGDATKGYLIGNLTIPTNQTMRGVANFGTAVGARLFHKTGVSGAMFSAQATAVNSCQLSNLHLAGNDEVGETYGIDLTGFRYCRFDNLWLGTQANEGFKLANLFANGTSGGDDVLQNLFVNCRFGNGDGDGFLVPSTGTNVVANTFLNCEFSGNGVRGINLHNGSAYSFYGFICQQNSSAGAAREIYIDDVHSSVIEGYYEPRLPGTTDDGRGIELTAKANRNQISVRSTFGLANTFVDNGTRNTISVRGEGNGDEYYDDPHFYRWVGSVPGDDAPGGTDVPPYGWTREGHGAGGSPNRQQNVLWGSYSTTEQGHGVTLIDNVNANGWVTLELNRWYANYVAVAALEGAHTGSDNASILTDSGQAWTVNQFIGWKILNTIDGSSVVITANTSTTITGTLAGGTENDWDTDEAYQIVSPLVDDLAGRWVTVAIDYDTRLFPDSTEMRLYTQLQGVVTGQAHFWQKPDNFVGRKLADALFPTGQSEPESGTDDTSSGAATMTDTTATFTASPADDDLVGWKILNLTDGSEGIVTSNTATVVTVVMTGGTNNNWDSGDSYIICPRGEIRFTYSHEATGGGNVLRISSFHVVDGQTQYVGDNRGRIEAEPIEVTTAQLEDPEDGINLHRKQTGKQVYNTDIKRIVVASGTDIAGSHTGANNAASLTDATKSWTTNQFIGFEIDNTTDGSSGRITSNTATTVSVALSGGTDADFDTGDLYIISYPWRESLVETVATGTFDLDVFGATQLDSSGGAITGTLGSGEYIGQIKTIVMTDAANSSTVSITNHQTSDPEVATFDAVDETGVFLWSGTEWITLFATCTFL